MSPMTINEFAQKLEIIQNEYSADASDVLEKSAKRMRRAIAKASPDSGKEHNNKLKKSWEMEMQDFYGRAPQAEISSKAPHFHLVNRGVQNPTDAHGNPKPEWKDRMNKHVGYLEKTVKKKWPNEKEKMAKDFYKKVHDHLG